MIRTVSTGDLGLDVLLGGGWRLVSRLPDRESATVLVRGGCGAGKTLIAIQVALELARSLDGDVAVGCVEILPTEYLAQLHSVRWDIEKSRIIVLPVPQAEGSAQSVEGTGPRVFVGLLTDLDPAVPDLVAALEALAGYIERAGGKPRAFLADSLSEGYGLGSRTPRTSADAVMKFAADRGCGLVLCEEASEAGASPWMFAADTVLELGLDPSERGRWLEVRKHRFGPSASGRHELELGGWPQAPKVYPAPHAWVTGRPHEELAGRHWGFVAGSMRMPKLQWHASFGPDYPTESFEGHFALVSSRDAGQARSLASALLPKHGDTRPDLLIRLDPLMLRPMDWSGAGQDVLVLPTALGPARALRWLLEQFVERFGKTRRPDEVPWRRVLLGDLGLLFPMPDALNWFGAVHTFVSRVFELGWGMPVVAYAEGCGGDIVHPEPTSLLRSLADVLIDVELAGNTHAKVWERIGGRGHSLAWSKDLAKVPLPDDLRLRSSPMDTYTR